MMSITDLLNPYAWLMRLRRSLYGMGLLRSDHPGIPVISVGNLTMGGTGKSPMVRLIANYIHRKHHKRVAIVSRGYGRSSKGYVLVLDGTQILAKVEESGDEAQMFAQTIDHAIIIVDEDRAHGARMAKNLGAEVIVLDDGFQHVRLRRDLNILLVDPSQSLSHVLPLGRRRESLAAAKLADVVIYTSGNGEVELPVRPGIPYARVRGVITRLDRLVAPASAALFATVKDLKNKRVLALSSIATPQRFHDSLREQGARVEPFVLADHARYTEKIVDQVYQRAAEAGVDLVIMTEKDAVKARRHFERHTPGVAQVPVYIVHYELEFLSGQESFYEQIDRALVAHSTHTTQPT